MLRLAESRSGHASGALGNETEFGWRDASGMMQNWTRGRMCGERFSMKEMNHQTLPILAGQQTPAVRESKLNVEQKPFRAQRQRPCRVTTGRQDQFKPPARVPSSEFGYMGDQHPKNSTGNRFAVLPLRVEEEPREIQGEPLVSSEARDEKLSCR